MSLYLTNINRMKLIGIFTVPLRPGYRETVCIHYHVPFNVLLTPMVVRVHSGTQKYVHSGTYAHKINTYDVLTLSDHTLTQPNFLFSFFGACVAFLPLRTTRCIYNASEKWLNCTANRESELYDFVCYVGTLFVGSYYNYETWIHRKCN